MTVAEFLRRLQLPPRNVSVIRAPDGGIEIEIHHDYRNTEWARIPPPARDDDTIDDELARAMCRRLGVSPEDIGF